MIKPSIDYYSFIDGSGCNAGGFDAGINQSHFIVEAVLDMKRAIYVARTGKYNYPFFIYKDGSVLNRILFRHDTGDAANLYYLAIGDAGSGVGTDPIYKNMFDFHIMHVVLSGGGNYYLYLDGQRVLSSAGAKNLDLSGNITAYIGRGNDKTHNICAFRLWNPSSIPVGYEAEIHRRVMNPWQRSTVFGDANLRLEYLLNSDIADASLVIPNSANPGVGDLTITPAAQWQNARQLYKTT